MAGATGAEIAAIVLSVLAIVGFIVFIVYFFRREKSKQTPKIEIGGGGGFDNALYDGAGQAVRVN